MTPRNVEIADLRQRVIIEAPVDLPDDAGSMTRSYRLVGAAWAQVVAVSGESRFEASRQESSVTHIVHVRWRSDIESEMRFIIASRRLLIRTAFDPDGRGRFLTCRCEEISS